MIKVDKDEVQELVREVDDMEVDVDREEEVVTITGIVETEIFTEAVSTLDYYGFEVEEIETKNDREHTVEFKTTFEDISSFMVEEIEDEKVEDIEEIANMLEEKSEANVSKIRPRDELESYIDMDGEISSPTMETIEEEYDTRVKSLSTKATPNGLRVFLDL